MLFFSTGTGTCYWALYLNCECLTLFAEVALVLIFPRVVGFKYRLLITLILTPHICYLGSKKTATYLPEVASEQGWDKAGRANYVATDRHL